MFTSVRTPRVYEHIVEQIERAIFTGQLHSGDRLPPERELVRQFGASRVAVREALRTLEHRGLVEVRHGSSGGHFVRDADVGLLRRDLSTLLRLARISIEQLTEARLVIEPEIAALAARRASGQDVESMRDLLAQRLAAGAAEGATRALDIAFHQRVAAAAQNPVHALLTEALMDIEADVVPRLSLDAESHARITGAHADIVGAVAASKPDAARTAMIAHIHDVGRRLSLRSLQPAQR